MLLFIQVSNSSHHGVRYFCLATLREHWASSSWHLQSLFIAFMLGFMSILTDISSASEKSINTNLVYLT